MSGPTPGPWVAHGLMVSEANQPTGRGRDICHCGIGMRHDPSESEANARLIAAAPELLAALLGLLRIRHRLPYRDGEVPEVAAAHAAIAKTGGAR